MATQTTRYSSPAQLAIDIGNDVYGAMYDYMINRFEDTLTAHQIRAITNAAAEAAEKAARKQRN